MQEQNFDKWMEKLESLFENMFGFSIYDLPDQPFHSWFDNGLSVGEAIKEIVSEEMAFLL